MNNKKRIIIIGIIVAVTILASGVYFAYGKVTNFISENKKEKENSIEINNQLKSKIESQQKQIEELSNKVMQKEQEQGVQNQANKKSLACAEHNRLLAEIKDSCRMMPYPGIEKCISNLTEKIDEFGKDYKKAKGLDKDELRKKHLSSRSDSKERMERFQGYLDKILSTKSAYIKASRDCGVVAK